MHKQTWEMRTLAWDKAGADGAVLQAAEVGDLIFAESKDDARNAFFCVAEVVGQNGWIYPCALPAIKTVLAALPSCTAAARFECLELVALIVSAEGAPGTGTLVEECCREARHAFWYFTWGLQCDDVGLASVYIDILACLGTQFDDLRDLTLTYLFMAKERKLLPGDVEMLSNTISELSKMAAASR